ncbi:MAG: hypothetical protein V4649_12215 [Bacteroidota bacterium]
MKHVLLIFGLILLRPSDSRAQLLGFNGAGARLDSLWQEWERLTFKIYSRSDLSEHAKTDLAIDAYYDTFGLCHLWDEVSHSWKGYDTVLLFSTPGRSNYVEHPKKYTNSAK